VTLSLVFGLAACSGDDDDNASSTASDSASGSASASAETVQATAESDTADLQASLDDANATIADQTAQITDLTAQVATANSATADAQAEAATEKARADQAEADLATLQTQVDDFKGNFPVTITSSLEGVDVIGAYNLHLTEAFCDGLATCGQARPVVRADIIQGSNGLELQVPNVFTTGLFMVEGSLFGATDSNLIVGPCADGTPTNSQVSTTIFANGKTVDIDGTKTLAGLGASLFVAVNPAGSCGAGNVFFSGSLTPA
jgi:hypothetical protein